MCSRLSGGTPGPSSVTLISTHERERSRESATTRPPTVTAPAWSPSASSAFSIKLNSTSRNCSSPAITGGSASSPWLPSRTWLRTGRRGFGVGLRLGTDVGGHLTNGQQDHIQSGPFHLQHHPSAHLRLPAGDQPDVL